MERKEETGREGRGLCAELILAHSMGGKTRVKLVKKQDRKQTEKDPEATVVEQESYPRKRDWKFLEAGC